MKHSILNKIFICLALLTSGQALFAQVETTALSEQIKTCKSNAAMTWDSTLNRCVYKKQDLQTQNQVADCGKIEDKAAREKCFLNIAENKSGLSSDTDKIYDSSGTTKSAVMNAASAYFMIANLNMTFGKDIAGNVPLDAPANSDVVKQKSKASLDEAESLNAEGTNKEQAKPDTETSSKSKSCMSKSILGMTGLAGLATDAWMKIQTKKKMAELKKAYQVDLENSAYDGQKKAFEYLLKEQETVKEMAGLEKKRNLALMAGYGAGLAMSVWEQWFSADPSCKFYTTK